MQRLSLFRLLLVAGCLAIGGGAAPAPPSYHGIERAIAEIRQSWARPGAPEQPNAPGWNTFFDALLGELREFAAATNENDRLSALNRLYKMWVALEVVPWRAGADLREELRTWLRPRVTLAWAERRLVDRVRGMAAPASAAVEQNRHRWLQFVDSDLGEALRRYDTAPTVAQRQEALKRLYAALNALSAKNAAQPWDPSVTLQTALNAMYDQPNLDISADAATLAPWLSHDVVTNGPIYYKGYVSQVTAGPKTGFGLMPSDNGIAFYNSQMMTSVTPIHDFQKQMASDSRGQRATRMYQFSATSQDYSQLTIVAVLTPNGLQLGPQYQHNVDAFISSVPQPGRNLMRAIASLIGFNQARITNEVYKNALPKMRENVAQNAQELGAQRTSEEAAIRNVEYRKYLIGYNRLALRNLLIEGLTMRSRPENALLGGTLRWLNARDQVGADMPQPSWLAVPAPGVSADLHLGSILTSLSRGYLQSDAVRGIDNLMVVTRPVPPGGSIRDAAEVVRNADYPTFLAAVAKAQQANDPKVLAIRVKRPTEGPEFSADARGLLVAAVHDFQIEVPAPPQSGGLGRLGGANAKVYRITSPRAEFVISFQVRPETEKTPIRLTGKIEDMDLGGGSVAKVYALGDDERKAQSLTLFLAAPVLGMLQEKVKGQTIDVPLSNLKLEGFAISHVSPLDPSGWMRVQLVRTSASPAAGIQTTASPAVNVR
jgi:hypothetical protein